MPPIKKSGKRQFSSNYQTAGRPAIKKTKFEEAGYRHSKRKSKPAAAQTGRDEADKPAKRTLKSISQEDIELGKFDIENIDMGSDGDESSSSTVESPRNKLSRQKVIDSDNESPNKVGLVAHKINDDNVLSSGFPYCSLEGLDYRLCRQLEYLKFVTMTKVQAHVFPVMMKGDRDILIRSVTGSGKTLAYLVPAINSLLRLENDKRKRLMAKYPSHTGFVINRSSGTRILILAPTRELAEELVETSKKLTQTIPWITCCTIVGGTKRKSEKASIRKGITILVSTPGRILDHLDTTCSFRCRYLSSFILDEADRLLDMGFEGRLKRIVEAIHNRMNDRDNFAVRRNQADWRKIHEESSKMTRSDSAAVRRALEEGGRPSVVEVEGGQIEMNLLLTEKSEPSIPVDYPDPSTGSIDPSDVAGTRRLNKLLDSFEPKIELQAVIVSATLSQGIKNFAAFLLRPDARWLGAENPKCAASDTDFDKANLAVELADWTVPETLRQAVFKVEDLKFRLMGLFSLLKLKEKRPGKSIIFVNGCDTVNYLHALIESLKWPMAPADSGYQKKEMQKTASVAKEMGKIRKRAKGMVQDIDELLFQMSDEEAENLEENCRMSLFTAEKVFPTLKAFKLHGSMNNEDRNGNLGDFSRAAGSSVLVTTDVAARGLNLPNVDFVIQLDPPAEISDYIHRVGRTARMGRPGTSVIFLAQSEMGYVDELKKCGACSDDLREREQSYALRLWMPGSGSMLPPALRKLRRHESVAYLVSRFTTFVEEEPALTTLAEKAYLSMVSGYRCFDFKAHFDAKKLHLGHLAGSFFIRKSPGEIGSTGPRSNSAPRFLRPVVTAKTTPKVRQIKPQTEKKFHEFVSDKDVSAIVARNFQENG